MESALPVSPTTPNDLTPAWRDAEAIRSTAAQVLSRPEYDLDRGVEMPSVSWLFELLKWLLTPLRLLFEAMDGMPDGLRWIVFVLLCLLLVAIVAHIVWTLSRAFRPPSLSKLRLSTSEDTAVDPMVLEGEAGRLAQSGDYIGACRRLLQAALAWLQLTRQRRFRPGLTNTELLREYAASPVADPLQHLVGTIDAKWYGDEPCHSDDYELCRDSQARIRRIVQEKRDALGS